MCSTAKSLKYIHLRGASPLCACPFSRTVRKAVGRKGGRAVGGLRDQPTALPPGRGWGWEVPPGAERCWEGYRPSALPPLIHIPLIVLELDLRLVGEAHEEVEREVAVWGFHERKSGAPAV